MNEPVAHHDDDDDDDNDDDDADDDNGNDEGDNRAHVASVQAQRRPVQARTDACGTTTTTRDESRT